MSSTSSRTNGNVVRRRRPTAGDVAERAGVSRTTVSFVLNDSAEGRGIPDTTRDRVLEAARELSYVPSPAATVLARGRSNVVLGLLGDNPPSSMSGRLLERLSQALRAQGLSFIVQLGPTTDSAGADARRSIDVAAVVTLEPLTDQELAARQAAGIFHVVAFSGDAAGTSGSLERIEHQIGQLQAEHLVSRGHRQLGYAWPADPRLHREAQQRLDGVKRVCADRKLAEPGVFTAPLSPAGTAQKLQACRKAQPVTGVCAYNDEAALAVLAGAHQLGLDVPADLAVVGVDDDPVAAVAIPPLTTVALDLDPMIEFFVDTITAKLNDQTDPPAPHRALPQLITRQST